MRRKKAFINIFFSILLELVSVLAGFIIPRLFILNYGSDTNGLVNSITSFIGYITLLQTGVGSVIKASLYKPLAYEDISTISSVISTSKAFFKKITLITIVYVLLLCIFFPLFIAPQFEPFFTITLIIVISFSIIGQYFFGITYQMLIEADQKGYIYSILQILTISLNTLFTIILIKYNYSIQIVKFTTALLFVLRPFIMSLVVKRIYKIHDNAPVNNMLIKQRWDSFTHGIATFIHRKIDIFLLSFFSTLSNVSVYSVYYVITYGVSSIFVAIDRSTRGAFGNIIALRESKTLSASFCAYNFSVHFCATVCFATANITIFSFINIYIGNVSDAVYFQPVFGTLILFSEYLYCLRMPYYSIILTSGKFKETKRDACIEALVNLIVSGILVRTFGLIGVAIGTICAMCYRTITFALFLNKNILNLNIKYQLRRYIASFVSYIACLLITSRINYVTSDYISWITYLTIVFLINFMICSVISLTISKEELKFLVKKLTKRK